MRGCKNIVFSGCKTISSRWVSSHYLAKSSGRDQTFANGPPAVYEQGR